MSRFDTDRDVLQLILLQLLSALSPRLCMQWAYFSSASPSQEHSSKMLWMLIAFRKSQMNQFILSAVLYALQESDIVKLWCHTQCAVGVWGAACPGIWSPNSLCERWSLLQSLKSNLLQTAVSLIPQPEPVGELYQIKGIVWRLDLNSLETSDTWGTTLSEM